MVADDLPHSIFLTAYSDLLGIDADVVDDSTQMPLARLSITSCQFFPHEIYEAGNFFDGHFIFRGKFSTRSFRRLLCDVALGP
ncbi:hypothetical protein ILP92_14765 [Maribius pontilimi]|uniref:Uncharacterized protein n=1 Tax=Palleronia pontilimi TaxID=1964209 RepID=A0A934ME00_9RHOB|nr:hypothetical protein [Palleronia pontilimi]